MISVQIMHTDTFIYIYIFLSIVLLYSMCYIAIILIAKCSVDTATQQDALHVDYTVCSGDSNLIKVRH